MYDSTCSNNSTADSNEQLREPDLDILDPVSKDDYDVSSPPPHVPNVQEVTYTVIDAITKKDPPSLATAINI